MKDTDVAYCAGLVDGEAYIGVKKSKAPRGCINVSYQPRIQIRMVDEQAISFISSLFGGRYYKEKPHLAKGRPLYCYSASDRTAGVILRHLEPYLKVKKLQAEMVLILVDLKEDSQKYRTKISGYRNFPNIYGTPRMVPNLSLNDEYIDICEEIYLTCKRLNKTGI